MRQRRIDAVVTVGPGDKMFWGRLAGLVGGRACDLFGIAFDRMRRIASSCSIGCCAPLTDAFIAVAEPHGRYLAEQEGCPAAKVRVIPNGVDVEKFHPRWPIASLQEGICLDARFARGLALWRRCVRKKTTSCFCRRPS